MMASDIAFNLVNLPPTTDAGNFHDDTIQFCKLFENVDAFDFCSTIDNLPLSDKINASIEPFQVQPEKATSSSTDAPPPAPICAPSATFPEEKSTCTPPKRSLQDEETNAKAGRFKPFHEERWDQKLLELRAFRKRHGHCLVPHTYPPNPQLARWVKRQRRQFKLMQDGKPSTMTPDRVEILEQDGFVWDSHEAAWREKIEDLRKYRAKHGNCLVPSNYKENAQLATWVKCQRRQYKLYWEGKPSAMNNARIAQLEAEGFRWDLRHGAATSPTKVAKTASSDHQIPKKQEVESDGTDQQNPTKQLDNMSHKELKVLHDIISML